MQKYFLIALALLTVTLGGGVAPAHAEGGAEGSACNLYDDGSGGGRIQNGQCVAENLYNTQSVDPKAAATPTVAPPKLETPSTLSGVLVWVASLFAWLLYVATTTLDFVVYFTVVKMGSYLSNLSAVGVAWKVMRDVGNILLIFGFLAAGIMTILYNVQWYGFNRKMLPALLVAAVFLNFSLFFAEAVVDTGNLFATQVYQQINGGPVAPPAFDSVTTQKGLSVKIMNQLGLQNLYEAGKLKPEVYKEPNNALIAFLSIFLFLIATFVFFSLAFILVTRFVYLIYLIITSPIGFAGWIFPPMASVARTWWSSLFRTAFTAPILFLLLYIALRVITDAQFLTGFIVGSATPSWTGFVTTDAGGTSLMGFASIFLSFIVAMGLLLFVVIASKKLAAVGGEGATKLAGKLSFGLTAWGMRSTAGWGMQRGSQLLRKSRLGRVPIVGRTLAGALDRGAKASFDVRGAKVLGGLGGIGVSAGEAQKGGFREWEKEKIKGREEYAKTLEQTRTEKQQTKDAEGNKKTAERNLAQLKTQNGQAIQRLANEQHAALQPFNDRITAARQALQQAQAVDERVQGAQQVLDRARAAGDIGAIQAAQQALDQARAAAEGNHGNIEAAQLALNNELLDAQRMREAQKREGDALQAEHKRLEGAIEDQIKAYEATTAALKRAPQEGYAAGLRLYLPEDSFINEWVNPQRNTKAAKNIIETAGKTKKQKDLETLLTAVEGAAHPAPAAAPVAAAPAGGGGAAGH